MIATPYITPLEAYKDIVHDCKTADGAINLDLFMTMALGRAPHDLAYLTEMMTMAVLANAGLTFADTSGYVLSVAYRPNRGAPGVRVTIHGIESYDAVDICETCSARCLAAFSDGSNQDGHRVMLQFTGYGVSLLQKAQLIRSITEVVE